MFPLFFDRLLSCLPVTFRRLSSRLLSFCILKGQRQEKSAVLHIEALLQKLGFRELVLTPWAHEVPGLHSRDGEGCGPIIYRIPALQLGARQRQRPLGILESVVSDGRPSKRILGTGRSRPPPKPRDPPRRAGRIADCRCVDRGRTPGAAPEKA